MDAMKNIQLLNVIIFFLPVISSSCKKHNSSPPIITTSNMYIVGNIPSPGWGNAVLWNNGTTTYLADTSLGPSDARTVFLAGNDVYIGGSTFNNIDTAYIATYWKNGIAKQLSSPLKHANISSMYVDGSDVYTAGNAWDYTGHKCALFWKNDSFTILDSISPTHNPNGQVPFASSIFISGNDIYVAGQNDIGGCYWKNGTATNLNTLTCWSAYVSGSDFYVTDDQMQNGITNPAYLKNGTLFPLSPSPANLNAYSGFITMSGTDLYVLGAEYLAGNNNNSVIMYWKNGTPTIVGDTSKYSSAGNLIVNGTDIYIAGATGPTSQTMKATYWKNGKAVSLTASFSNAAAIAIK
jgi:hypothetical protein